MDNEQLLLAISDMMDKKLVPINNRLGSMENRLDRLESQVKVLNIGQTELRKELKEVNIRVSDTYQLALDAWGKSTENRRWLEDSKIPL